MEKVKEIGDLKEYLAYARKTFSHGGDPAVLIRTNILPIPHYLNTIAEGVKQLDRLLGTKNMEREFLKTSYLYFADKELERDFGCINLIQYFRILDAKRIVMSKKFKEGIAHKDKLFVRSLYQQLGL